MLAAAVECQSAGVSGAAAVAADYKLPNSFVVVAAVAGCGNVRRYSTVD